MVLQSRWREAPEACACLPGLPTGRQILPMIRLDDASLLEE